MAFCDVRGYAIVKLFNTVFETLPVGPLIGNCQYKWGMVLFSLGKSAILVLFPNGTFSFIIGKSTIIFKLL